MIPKILVIEDNTDFIKMVNEHLHQGIQNIKIYEISSGELGIKEAEKERPDIIFVDIMLPDMNGIEVATVIKEKLSQSRIILLTIFDSPEFKKSLGLTKSLTLFLAKTTFLRN